MYYEDRDRPNYGIEENNAQQGAPGLPPAEDPSADAQKKNRRRTAKKVIAAVLACVLVGGAGGTAYYIAGGGFGGTADKTTAILESGRTGTEVVTERVSSTGELLAMSEIYAKYAASTVGIATEITTTNIFGETTKAAAAGSGFFITSDGYVITNYHVIEHASTIRITCFDGTEYEARLIGGDADSDIAVLKIDAEGIAPVVIGNSDAMLVGEDVAAIGNPLGELTFTFTSGIVSALDRSITTSDGTIYNMIQTDCAVNSGNSGGPLFNGYGEVVGIVSAKYASTGVEGLSFALPINEVIERVTDIMEYGYVTGKPYMGITVSTVTGTDAQRYNLAVGAYVNSVAAGSCSETAGLKQGDVITAMDGKTVLSQADLISLKNTFQAGDTVPLTVVRAGETLTLTLTFDEQTPEAEAANTAPAAPQEKAEAQDNAKTQDDDWGSYFYSPWGSQHGTNGGTIY